MLRIFASASLLAGTIVAGGSVGRIASPAAAAPVTTWTNPVSKLPLHDPTVLRDGSTYYMFGSFTGADIPVLSSADLASWSLVGDALPVQNLGAWVDPTALSSIGGPSVVAQPNGYVLYYSARSSASGVQCIGAATASSPAGPYAGAATPLVCDPSKGNAITPAVFTNGSTTELLWVYDNGAGNDQVLAQPLAVGGLSFAVSSTPAVLLTATNATSDWERGFIDNPTVVPGSSPPMLMYSSGVRSDYRYGINWATCSTDATGVLTGCTRGQLGPWTWFQFRSNVNSPGAADYFTDGSGAVWMVYTGVDGTCLPDCATAATPRLDKLCIDTSNGIQPRTTAPSTGGLLARTPGNCSADVATPAENWLAADAMFKKDPQWRGADGAHSIPIGKGKVVWTFGDSFIDVTPYSPDASVQWSRIGSSFIRNSMAVETGTNPADPATTYKAYWQGGTTPTDFFPSQVAGHWLWDAGGVMVGDRMLIWNSERTGPGLGTYDREVVVYVDNPAKKSPNLWVQHQGIPNSPAADFGFVPEPIAPFHDGSYVYVYYNGGGAAGCNAPAGMRLARFADSDLLAGNFGSREWWDGTTYRAQHTFTSCSGAPPVIDNMTMVNGGSGGDVVKDAAGRFAEYAGGAFFGGLNIQAATAPTGPWPGGTNVMTAPESTRDNVQTYVWCPHPELTGNPSGTMWATWNSNGPPVFTDETLYYPRFARVTVP